MTSGSVLALVTWELGARGTGNLGGSDAAPGAGSFATEAVPEAWRGETVRGVVPTPLPRPARMQKTNRSGEV